MSTIQDIFTDFRNKLYQLFPKRRDAIFNLMDANSASGKSFTSVVQLSNSEFFPRQYPSITDALTDGLETAPWEDIQKLVWQTVCPKGKTSLFSFYCRCYTTR